MNQPHAPLYVDTLALCEWLLGHFDNDSRTLPKDLCKCSLDLLEALTLALKGRRRDENLEIADERLIWLRTQLRLAHTMSYLNRQQLLYALEQTDLIGRQLGGWLRTLEPI